MKEKMFEAVMTSNNTMAIYETSSNFIVIHFKISPYAGITDNSDLVKDLIEAYQKYANCLSYNVSRRY